MGVNFLVIYKQLISAWNNVAFRNVLQGFLLFFLSNFKEISNEETIAFPQNLKTLYCEQCKTNRITKNARTINILALY